MQGHCRVAAAPSLGGAESVAVCSGSLVGEEEVSGDSCAYMWPDCVHGPTLMPTQKHRWAGLASALGFRTAGTPGAWSVGTQGQCAGPGQFPEVQHLRNLREAMVAFPDILLTRARPASPSGLIRKLPQLRNDTASLFLRRANNLLVKEGLALWVPSLPPPTALSLFLGRRNGRVPTPALEQ